MEDTPQIEPDETSPAESEPESFLPMRTMRHQFESYTMRVIATLGVVAIGTALGAILGWQDVRGWIIGLVASGVSVLLAAVLWSSRTL
jgi:hypothetical protein